MLAHGDVQVHGHDEITYVSVTDPSSYPLGFGGGFKHACSAFGDPWVSFPWFMVPLCQYWCFEEKRKPTVLLHA